MMSLLILCATTKEMAALAPGLFPRPKEMPEMQPMRGPIRNGSAIFMVTGVGPINAALALGLCFGLFHESTSSDVKIDAALFCGLAGAFDLHLTPLLSICHINEEIWPEYGLHDGTNVTARAFRHPLWEKTDQPPVYERLPLANIEALPEASPKKDLDWPSCASLTVAGVTASFARREALWNQWRAPLENMEGFAAAYACLRAEIPMVEIRVVSNKVGPRSAAEKDFEGALKTMKKILPSLGLL